MRGEKTRNRRRHSWVSVAGKYSIYKPVEHGSSPKNHQQQELASHLPSLTHDSSFSLPAAAFSSAQSLSNLARTLVCLQASLVKPLISACVLLMSGTFSSYSQLKSAIFRIVTGMSIQPAVMPTAKGTVARKKRF